MKQATPSVSGGADAFAMAMAVAKSASVNCASVCWGGAATGVVVVVAIGVLPGTVIEPAMIDEGKLRNKKSLNVALLGVLSRHLAFSEQQWIEALRRNLPEALVEVNVQAFQLGRGQ